MNALYTAAILSLVISISVPSQAQNKNTDYLELRENVEAAFVAGNAQDIVSSSLALIDGIPNDPEAWYALSVGYELTGEYSKAVEAAERVQELGYTTRAFLPYRIAQLAMRAEMPNRAMDWLEQALKQRYEERQNFLKNDVFSPLRDNPRFQKLAAVLPKGLTRREGLEFDLNYLVEEAQRMHAGLEGEAFSEPFMAEVERLRGSLDTITDYEFLAGTMRLAAILNDGHTAIYGAQSNSPLDFVQNRLPLRVYWFEDGFYVLDGSGEYSKFAGYKVLKIGNLDIEEVLNRLEKYRGQDNSQTWKWLGPQSYMSRIWLLREIGATRSLSQVNMTLESPDGEIAEYEVIGKSEEMPRKLIPSPALGGELPLYLSNMEPNFWMKEFEDKRTLYFQFNRVRNRPNETIAQFNDRLKTELLKGEIQNLIIDMRHNNGGNGTLFKGLIQTLITFEEANENNKIYVLTGRDTFSAAQIFINQVSTWTNATFVGEPSSASPNFVGEETEVVLPYSKIYGSISTLYWQLGHPNDNRPWIDMDIYIPTTAEDFFAGQDKVLEAVQGLIVGSPSVEVKNFTTFKQNLLKAYGEQNAEEVIHWAEKYTKINPLDAQAFYMLSKGYEWNEDYLKAAGIGDRVQEMGYNSHPFYPHRIARMRALGGEDEIALELLEASVAGGYSRRNRIGPDHAFSAFADTARFKKIIGALPRDNMSRREGLEFDLGLFVEEAQRMHRGLTNQAFSKPFLDKVESIRTKLDTISDAEFLASVMQAMALLGDGHSGLFGRGADGPLDISGNRLPFKFYGFEEGFYIVDGKGDLSQYAGSKVLKIGGIAIETIMAELDNFVGGENTMVWKWFGPDFYLRNMWMLNEIGATTGVEEAEITIENENGTNETITIKASTESFAPGLRTSPAMEEATPLYLSNRSAKFWLKDLPEEKAVYFQFNQVFGEDNETLDDFANRLKSQLQVTQAKNLIIDMRHNGGGSNTLIPQLIKAVVGFEGRSPDHKIYIITGRNTFSAAQNFISRIENLSSPIFVGEPSSSSPNFVGETTEVVLPYSNIRGSISNMYWQDGHPQDNRPWILPHVPVPPRAKDYFKGRDAAMDAIKEIIRKSQANS